MSNQDAAAPNVDAIARAVSERIRSTLGTQGHSVLWLSANARIPSTTLARNLDDAGEFKLKHLIAIAFTLKVDFGWLNTGDSE